MGIGFKHLCIAVLFLGCVGSGFAFQPSGGVLSLDGVDDYAILPFASHGYLFPNNTREFTVEMWFYPRTGPTHGGNNIIFSQQIYFGLTGLAKCKGAAEHLCCFGGAYLDGKDAHGVIGFYVPAELNRWNYMAIFYEDSTLGFIYNDRIRRRAKIGLMDRLTAEVRGRPDDFFLGGYNEPLALFAGALPVLSFYGEIDVIRFSKVARYDFPDIPAVEGPFEPPERFVNDRHTVALWNFNEREGATRFEDESKHERTLIGMNGAAVSRALAVNPGSNSITTTWGRIRSSAF